MHFFHKRFTLLEQSHIIIPVCVCVCVYCAAETQTDSTVRSLHQIPVILPDCEDTFKMNAAANNSSICLVFRHSPMSLEWSPPPQPHPLLSLSFFFSQQQPISFTLRGRQTHGNHPSGGQQEIGMMGLLQSSGH